MPFVKGKSGNPKGKKVGCRDNINRRFLEDLEDAWVDHGPAAIEAAIEQNPLGFVALVASFQPKDKNAPSEGPSFGTVSIQQITVWIERAGNNSSNTLNQIPSADGLVLPAPICIEQTPSRSSLDISEDKGSTEQPEWLSGPVGT